MPFQTYYIEYYARYLEEYQAALASAGAAGVGLDEVTRARGGEANPVSASVEDAPNDGDDGVLLGGGVGDDFSSNGTASFCAIM